MGKMLFIVSVYRPDVYQYVRDAFGVAGHGVEIILDRRVGERRRPDPPQETSRDLRQRTERRRVQVDARLRAEGWAIVASDEAPVAEIETPSDS